MKDKKTHPLYKQKDLFFCDQGEFLGGAEFFLLDMMPRILDKNIRNFRGFLVGGECVEYQDKLDKSILRIPFAYPPVRGNIFVKIFRAGHLAISAGIFSRNIQKISGKKSRIFFTNTPRTHFLLFFAKKIFHINGAWLIMMHDFTTPPRLIKLMGNKADVLIANSLPMRNFLHESLDEKDYYKVRLVENGIDLDFVDNLEKSEKFQKNLIKNNMIDNILLLGRIDPRKGQMHLLEAADFLLERNPHLKFNIVGSPAQNDQRTVDYHKECIKFKKDRNLSSIIFTPTVDNPFEVIANNDLLVALPTEPETFGRIITEGLAMGKMVLSFDQTGPKEILDHFLRYVEKNTGENLRDHKGRNPLLIEPNNSMDLAEKIGFLADHPEISEIFTPHARNFIRENYSTKSTEKAMLQILESVK